jgi:hypothetical protein
VDVSAGDPVRGKLSAGFFRDTGQMLDWYKRNKARGEGGNPNFPAQDSHVTVMVKNNSGEVVRRGEVLEFNGSLLAPLRTDAILVAGDTPDLTNVGWGVLLEPAETGKIRECLIVGTCLAFVNVTDESHKYANRAEDSRVLQSAASGPVKLIFKPTGGTPPEERECIVQLVDEGGPPQVQLVRAASESTYPLASEWFERGSGTTPPQANIFSFRTGYTATFDDTEDFQNPFATLPDGDPTYIRALNLTGHYVPENQWCLAYLLNGKYVVEYELPRMLTVTLLGDLIAAGYTTATVYSSIAPDVSLGTIRVHDFYTPADRQFSAGQKATAVLHYDSGWKYVVSTIASCAAEVTE